MENTSSFNLEKVISDAMSVIKNPVGFYQKMAKAGGYAEPVIFVVVMAVIAAIALSLLSLVTGKMPMAAALGSLIFMPIVIVIASFISAAIIFAIWKLMGSPHNYETAYRCMAYSMALMPIMAVLSLIPYASILGTIWAMYLLVVASTEVHGLKKTTALIVFGILGFFGVMSNIAGERMQDQLSEFEAQLSEGASGLEGLEDMTPEEAGKALGELLKGMEGALSE